MKKDIEWLKKEIAIEMIQLEPNRVERWLDVQYQTLRSVAQKLDQLDELEVLSQEESINIVLHDLKEYIKEQQSLSHNTGLAHTSAGNDTHYRQYDYVLECINEYEPSDELQKLLVPKQEELESKIKVLIEAYKQEDGAYSNPENGWISGFVEDLENLVEEEQKYYVLLGNQPHDDNWTYALTNLGSIEVFEKDVLPEWDRTKLTEQEIKDYDERYWTFAKPVEELEE